MLAGRVGGALTAELGTMNVTEQLLALRSMGADPVHFLVTPRFLACLILTPLLTAYADIMGALGAWLVYSGVLWRPNTVVLGLHGRNRRTLGFMDRDGESVLFRRCDRVDSVAIMDLIAKVEPKEWVRLAPRLSSAASLPFWCSTSSSIS